MLQKNEKDDLQEEMTHLLNILRNFLSNLHQEYNALAVENLSVNEALMHDRFKIIESFTFWSEKFSVSLRLFMHSMIQSLEIKQEITFEEELDLMEPFLDEEDVELLLIRTQLVDILKEIRHQSHENLQFFEGVLKSSIFHPPEMMPQGALKKVIVGLLDVEAKKR